MLRKNPEFIQAEQSDAGSDAAIKEYREAREAAYKELGIPRRHASFEQRQAVERLVYLKGLYAGGAKPAFGERGIESLDLTPDQVDQIKQDWAKYVDQVEARYQSMTDEGIRKRIRNLEHPERNRGGELQKIHKLDPEISLEHEQLERAALKELLLRRHAGKNMPSV